MGDVTIPMSLFIAGAAMTEGNTRNQATGERLRGLVRKQKEKQRA